MAPERRNRVVLLAALLVVLALVAAYQFWSRPSPAAAPASNGRESGRTAARGAGAAREAPVVHLPALEEQQRPKPIAGERNLFRFKPKAPPPEPPRPPIAAQPPMPSVPPGPTVPPITLKFIGIVEEQGGRKRKIAVLSDGHSALPIYGEEGKVILGQYKILRIGAESIEISYVDGSGRRTIRLSGS
jgi:hypothetical protein